MDREKVQMTIEDGALLLRGEKKQNIRSGENGCYRLERAYIASMRSIPPWRLTAGVVATERVTVTSPATRRMEAREVKSSGSTFAVAEAAFGMGTSVEFDSDWLTLGKHRVRLRCTRGFPSERTRSVAELAKIAVENNLSAAARLVEVVAGRGEKSYTITIGTTFASDKEVAPPIELALATIFGLAPGQLTMEVVVVSQTEVDMHAGVYERMLAEKLRIVPPIQ